MLLSLIQQSEPTGPITEKCYSLLRGEDLMQVHSNALNVVLGRDIRKNVAYSATMAIEMAAKGNRVTYMNTYASEQLIRASFGEQTDASDRIDVLDVPTGEWFIRKIKAALDTHRSDTLIINSFEFTALDRYRRERVASMIVDLRVKRKDLTVIVFSHDMKKELEAGCAGKGAIGMLASRAEALSRVGEAEAARQAAELAFQKQNRSNQQGNGSVHEKRTLKKSRLPRKFGGENPDPSVYIENDRGFSYHYSDFWANPFYRGPNVSYEGKEMSLFARTPLLQAYLLAHPNKQFSQGNTPTEAELMAQLV